MNTISCFETHQAAKRLQSRVTSFFDSFTVGTLLNASGIRKTRGASPLTIFQAIFQLAFEGANFYRGIALNSGQTFAKDAAYAFLENPKHNWRAFLLKLSILTCRFYDVLTSEDRVKVLIADDSIYNRDRSKKVELLARVFDHNTGRFLKGFKLLQLGWSDGASFVPLDFVLRSSANARNRLQESTRALDQRCCSARRRKEAISKSTLLLEEMVSRVVSRGVRADYLLMDSWFCFPGLIARLSAILPVICMGKDLNSTFFYHRNVSMRLGELYKRLRKKPGKARVLASAIVEMQGGTTVKVVFVRHRNTRKWLALLCTDLELADEEIIRIYGRRWDIEVFFKMAKQHLNLEREVQLRNYDGLVGHVTIVLSRYIFLAYEQRLQADPRTLGNLFHACCSEMADLTMLESLYRLLMLVAEKFHATARLTDAYIESLLDAVMAKVFEMLHSSRGISGNSNQILASSINPES